jgi:hypothetical protein
MKIKNLSAPEAPLHKATDIVRQFSFIQEIGIVMRPGVGTAKKRRLSVAGRYTFEAGGRIWEAKMLN